MKEPTANVAAEENDVVGRKEHAAIAGTRPLLCSITGGNRRLIKLASEREKGFAASGR